ncbi:hypothetical protein A1395_12910 [Pseudomonas protegens]|nr:hypothetical protein A1395_12910 [Pseudomonas protegens]
MIIIIRTIQISRHYTSIVSTILTVITFTQLDSSNLRNRIGLICWLQLPLQQITFSHWLRSCYRINARGPQKEQFLHTIHMRRVNHISLHYQVFINEFCGIGIIRMNTPYFRRSHVNLFNFIFRKKSFNSPLIKKI